jgi:hypothetical protein
VTDGPTEEEAHTDLLSMVINGLCAGHHCETVVNALVNTLADVICYAFKVEYHDEIIDELAEHLRVAVAVREAETTKLQ